MPPSGGSRLRRPAGGVIMPPHQPPPDTRPPVMLNSPLVWIAATLTVYAAATNLSWAAANEPERLVGLRSLLERVNQRVSPEYAKIIARACYYLGIPSMAVVLHVTRPSHMGLVTPPSVASLILALAIVAATAAVLAGGRFWLDRAARRAPRMTLRPLAPATLGWLALGALFREAHWAFFRAGPLSAGLDSATVAVFLGLGLLALEAWSNPWHRTAFDDVLASHELAEGAALALMSALVFLSTGSSPVCLVAHVTVACFMESLARAPHALPPEPFPSREGAGPSAGRIAASETPQASSR